MAIGAITVIFRAYLTEQSMEHLSATLKRGGVKDLLAFFPPNKRDGKHLEEHFRAENLGVVADWWVKKQSSALKESMVKTLADMQENEDTPEQVRAKP